MKVMKDMKKPFLGFVQINLHVLHALHGLSLLARAFQPFAASGGLNKICCGLCTRVWL
jgi:hypothetical protein